MIITCESVSSPLSSLQNALFGSPDTNARAKVPLEWGGGVWELCRSL